MSAPAADAAAPVAPTQAAAEQAPAPAVRQAQPVQGAAQPQAAPAPRRSRAPRGPIPAMKGPSSSGAPALLELAAAIPMHTVQRRSANFFVPDSNVLFHVLSICDGMMGTTHRFLQSSPAWLPIVSQLYVSVLLTYHIMRTYANSGYGIHFANILRDLNEYLRLDECVIPGPIVPFFQSLTAVNGPFDWIGDVTPALPDFSEFWNSDSFQPGNDWLRSVPVPALLLDQLAHFATWAVPANQTLYGNFEWFRNIFSVPAANTALERHRIGPHASGSLYTTQAQVDAARAFWNPAMQTFTRINAAPGQPRLTNWGQYLGFVSQTGNTQLDWFQHVAIVMQKYCQYFNGSAAVKSISPVGLGSVLIHAEPQANQDTRDWLYPATLPAAFLSSRFLPNHEFPTRARLDFVHADHDVEEVAEQYAVLSATNVQWARNNGTQHGHTAIDVNSTHAGDYWLMMQHRQADSVNLKSQFAQLISSRYHQVTALRAE